MSAPLITSTSNPLVKELSALHSRRRRNETGTFLIEGRRESSRAIGAGFAIDVLIVCPDLLVDGDLDAPPDVRRFELGPDAFARISRRQNPDGIIMRASVPDLTLPEPDMTPGSVILVAEGIEKPGNLGAMVRSSEAFGATAVVLADPVTDPFNPNAVRASQGAIFSTSLHVGTAAEVISWLRLSGTAVVAGYPAGGLPPWEVDLRGGVALVVGSEASGLTPPWGGVAEHVTIPMGRSSGADSFNAATTASLLLYEAMRQRSRG